MSESPFKLRWK